jgi:hypothetical protein
MAADITSLKARVIRDLRAVLARSRALRKKLVINGRFASDGHVRPLPNADKRDITTFLFFETAAAFESFAQEAFILCARKVFGVSPKRAEHIAGSSDRGLERTMGWAAPPMLVKRSKAIFGRQYFLSRLDDLLPKGHYEWLSHAHRVRNRIAHPSNRAKNELRRLHTALGIPAAQRQGTGAGRILSDYPANAPEDNRWFHRFLDAYKSFSDLCENRI